MKGQFVPRDTWTILDVFSVDSAAEKKRYCLYLMLF